MERHGLRIQSVTYVGAVGFIALDKFTEKAMLQNSCAGATFGRA